MCSSWKYILLQSQIKYIIKSYNNQMSEVNISQLSLPSAYKTNEDPDVAGFVYKTFEILGVEQYQKIVYWSHNGLQFIIKDIVKFEEIVLPRYFRHKKINSFVRQLNMYGFHKMKHNNFKSTFRHEMFQKDRPDLLPLIKRKPKFNDKQNQDSQQIRISTPVVKTEKPASSIKQDEPTMCHQKWKDFSQQFLQTTKMINLSLVKVSYNQLSDIVNLIPEEDDCVSIEDELEDSHKEEPVYLFEDPACFFASKFDF